MVPIAATEIQYKNCGHSLKIMFDRKQMMCSGFDLTDSLHYFTELTDWFWKGNVCISPWYTFTIGQITSEFDISANQIDHHRIRIQRAICFCK